MFFKKNNIENTGTCIVLYSFDFNRNLTQSLFDFFVKYCFENFRITFKYMGFYDETYRDNYGKIESVKEKLNKKKWDEIVNLALDDESIIQEKRTLGLEFNISRPITITVVISNKNNLFDIKEFAKEIYTIFNISYGFSYLTNISQWSTAYANGDWQHSKQTSDKIRISQSVVENWKINCEKIQEGFIRDIYRQNILNKLQLDMVVNNQSLESLIKGSSLGELNSINENIFLWELSESQLESARNKLYNTGVVL